MTSTVAYDMPDPMKVQCEENKEAKPSSESGDSTAPSSQSDSRAPRAHSCDSTAPSTPQREVGEDEANVASKDSGEPGEPPAGRTLLSAQAKPFKIGEPFSSQGPLGSGDQFAEILKHWNWQGGAPPENAWDQDFEGMDPALWALPPWYAMGMPGMPPWPIPGMPGMPPMPYPAMDPAAALPLPILGADAMAEQPGKAV